MPFEEFIVCDSDMHVLEPADLWQRYIADEFKHAAPVGMTELKRDLRVKIKSQVLLKVGPVRPLKERGGSGIGWRLEQEAAYAEAEAKGWGPEAQLDAMAKEGVDLAVLFPSRGLFALTIDSSEQIGADGLEPEYAAAIARGHPGGPTGLAQIHELVVQLRGEAGRRQVENARVGLAHLVGGGSVCTVSLLARDR